MDRMGELIAVRAGGAVVKVLLHGATIIYWKAAGGKNRLFLSS